MLSRNEGVDRFEQEKVDFFQRIKECYLDRAQQDPLRMKIIDANQTIADIQSQLSLILDSLLAA